MAWMCGCNQCISGVGCQGARDYFGQNGIPAIPANLRGGCASCKHFADATRALDSLLRGGVIERDDLRKRVEELTAERDALQNGDAFKVENETLRAQIALLTKERDEARFEQNRLAVSIGDVDTQLKSNMLRAKELIEAEFAPAFDAAKRVDAMQFELNDANARLDELRRVIAELVRK